MSGLYSLFCNCTDITVAGPFNKGPVDSSRRIGSGPPSPLCSHRLMVVRASEYEADEEDPIDVEFAEQLRALPEDATAHMQLCRHGPGEYDLEDRRLMVYWSTKLKLYNGGKEELLVHERDTAWPAGGGDDMPLSVYLCQAASVAASLGGRSAGAPAVSRIPARQRLTFMDEATFLEDPGHERLRSMAVACQQARLRESAAEAYEQSSRHGSTTPVQVAPGAPVVTTSLGSATPTPGAPVVATTASLASATPTPPVARYPGTVPARAGSANALVRPPQPQTGPGGVITSAVDPMGLKRHSRTVGSLPMAATRMQTPSPAPAGPDRGRLMQPVVQSMQTRSLSAGSRGMGSPPPPRPSHSGRATPSPIPAR